ncbi:MAG: radical SAM protein [Planctomycetaceae bacterium]|nr:radical SAM protein [Planctomycetaceae bacterium]
MQSLRLTTDSIITARGSKNAVDARRPYAFLVEPEHSSSGRVEDVATIFLTNRECPFRCLMCDLWKNTTEERVPVGAIPDQIDYALSRLPPAKHIKLYNSGNFFDHQAIPPEDYEAIADRVRDFETVIVENHPKLLNDDCFRFRDLIAGELEVAIGLETAHPEVLQQLNKQMTINDFEQVVRVLSKHDIATRAFILLRPPFLSESEGVQWALRSMEFAFGVGVLCCALIPTRDGNGIMEQLGQAGEFTPPSIRSLEEAFEAGLAMKRGRAFVDLWDVEKFYDCQQCGAARRDRLQQMNLTQKILPAIDCRCCA